jgi:hypothetical protein
MSFEISTKIALFFVMTKFDQKSYQQKGTTNDFKIKACNRLTSKTMCVLKIHTIISKIKDSTPNKAIISS